MLIYFYSDYFVYIACDNSPSAAAAATANEDKIMPETKFCLPHFAFARSSRWFEAIHNVHTHTRQLTKCVCVCVTTPSSLIITKWNVMFNYHALGNGEREFSQRYMFQSDKLRLARAPRAPSNIMTNVWTSFSSIQHNP